jgi:uncharacterized integral membrane protein (TIGR00698 family)
MERSSVATDYQTSCTYEPRSTMGEQTESTDLAESTLTPAAPEEREAPERTGLNEDWLAVWLGFFLIGAALVGLRLDMFVFRWASANDLIEKVLGAENLTRLGVTTLVVFLSACVGIVLSGGHLLKFVAGFPVVCLLALSALVIAGNSAVHGWGLEFVLFALVLGLFISNVLGVPPWLQEAVRTEFYIKTGLVILGTSVLFGEILQAGARGMVQALLVVIPVWFCCFWVARRLRVDDEFNVMLSTAVSICGVSAAIAACGAIQGDRRKLSYVTSLVLIVAVPMMVVMPWIVKATDIPAEVGGAWLGGTLDTSGSVVAAASLISEQAMKTGVVVKLSQNVLIGLAAFLLAIWWTIKKQPSTDNAPCGWVIWERFPKFVLGFLAASLLFSFAIDSATARQVKPMLDGFRTFWFALAFTSIGLETRFAELLRMEGGRPALAFLVAQAFNLIWTLLLAFLLFGSFGS